MAISALPAATNLGGSEGLAGGIISTSKPASLKRPFSFAIITGPWSGFINQSSNNVTLSLANALLNNNEIMTKKYMTRLD